MVALGLVLLVLAVLLTLGIVLFNGDPSGAEAFGVSLSNVSIGGLFLTGVITGVVGALGLGMILGGLKHRRSKTVRSKRAVRSARGKADTLAEENARLQEELERERAAQASSAPPATGTSDTGRHAPGSGA